MPESGAYKPSLGDSDMRYLLLAVLVAALPTSLAGCRSGQLPDPLNLVRDNVTMPAPEHGAVTNTNHVYIDQGSMLRERDGTTVVPTGAGTACGSCSGAAAMPGPYYDASGMPCASMSDAGPGADLSRPAGQLDPATGLTYANGSPDQVPMPVVAAGSLPIPFLAGGALLLLLVVGLALKSLRSDPAVSRA